MALRGGQYELALATQYQVNYGIHEYNKEDGVELTVIGGTVDIYVSEESVETAPTGMQVVKEGFVGIGKLGAKPNFIYIAQDTGTTTAIVLKGATVAEVA